MALTHQFIPTSMSWKIQTSTLNFKLNPKLCYVHPLYFQSHRTHLLLKSWQETGLQLLVTAVKSFASERKHNSWYVLFSLWTCNIFPQFHETQLLILCLWINIQEISTVLTMSDILSWLTLFWVNQSNQAITTTKVKIQKIQ